MGPANVKSLVYWSGLVGMSRLLGITVESLNALHSDSLGSCSVE